MPRRRLESFVVMGFGTTHEALTAEEALRVEGLDVVPIPTPRSLGALCGIAMRIPPAQADTALAVLTARGTPPTSIARIEDIVAPRED